MVMVRKITLRVLDGPDRGNEFQDFPLPLKIGREGGNTILLNDERVSRYHLNILEKNGKILLADCNSTNGTRLNGETVMAAEIHIGDIISLGRSVLIVGTQQEITKRLELLDSSSPKGGGVLRSFMESDEWEDAPPQLKAELASLGVAEKISLENLHRLLPPSLPEGLNIEQFAQISDILLYYLIRIRMLVNASIPYVTSEKASKNNKVPENNSVTLNYADWQGLLELYAQTAKYLRNLKDY
ncbi:MAG: FHA domain-containing protein [Planctomycetia bacterium]|nr:FHA domain-containing protein [Planctomycetia bacterium]